MIEISQDEFEIGIQDVVDGKTTREKLMKNWHMGADKLNTRIQELKVYNSKLYEKFIKKFPYRPREYTHIDYEAVIIDILKNGYKRREWDDVYGVDSRTINRRIYDVEASNPELVALYREVSEYRKKQMQLPQELVDRIEGLKSKEIFLSEVCDNKRAELLERERQYTEAILQGKGATEASRIVGQGRVSKSINTLSRIDLERMTLKELNKEDDEGER